MDRKKALTFFLTIVTLVGLFFVTLPFVGSMKPSAKANAALPRIDISNLHTGEAKIYDLPNSAEYFGGYKLSLFIFKTTGGEVRAWELPTKNGNVGMPDLHWWKPYHPCKDFGLSSSQEQFACQDSDLPSDWWESKWQWDLRGNSIASNIDSMPSVTGAIEGKYFVYRKRS